MNEDISLNILSLLVMGEPVEFNNSGNNEDYTDLTASHLHVKIEITKCDETALPDREFVATVNLFFHVLFSQNFIA